MFLVRLLAILCAGLFSGAALYITLVEHPARMDCGTALAATEFVPSYRRGSRMQASLAAMAFVAAVVAWLNTSELGWLVGGILIVAVIPFTLLAILPTNKSLLDTSLDRDSEAARRLLVRWGRLHAVRTGLSLAAFGIFMIATIPGPWIDAAARPTGDSAPGARESVLKQNLFVLRSVISQYTLDKHMLPKSLDDLVRAGYIKQIPLDPMTGKPDWALDWEIINPGQHERGISDVHSSSPKTGNDRSAYSTW